MRCAALRSCGVLFGPGKLDITQIVYANDHTILQIATTLVFDEMVFTVEVNFSGRGPDLSNPRVVNDL